MHKLERRVLGLNLKSDRLADQVYRQAGSLIAEQSDVDSERSQLASLLEGQP